VAKGFFIKFMILFTFQIDRYVFSTLNSLLWVESI